MPFDKRAYAERLGIRTPPPRIQPRPLPDTVPADTDRSVAQKVRPGEIESFIGQWELRAHIETIVRAAALRDELPGHFLFFGAPGLGKTTMSKIVAHELDAKLKTVEAAAVRTATKMANTLGGLERGMVLFIDEVHSLPRTVQEMLGMAMEDRRITVSTGVNRTAQTDTTIIIEPFVLVAATTLSGRITGPLRDRFGFVGHLTYYEDSEIAELLVRASSSLRNKIDSEAADELASRSRGVPRIALRLLSQVADLAVVESGDPDRVITVEDVDSGLALFNVDIYGMTDTDRAVLLSLCRDHMGGPVGPDKLAQTSGVERGAIITHHEPFLLRKGLMRTTTRGRVADESAFHMFGLKVPPFLQRPIDLTVTPQELDDK